MRQIVNISLPNQLAQLVNEVVGTGQYATKSEFFRDLLRQWSEQKIINEVLESQRQMKKGQKYLLKSFKDLRKL